MCLWSMIELWSEAGCSVSSGWRFNLKKLKTLWILASAGLKITPLSVSLTGRRPPSGKRQTLKSRVNINISCDNDPSFCTRVQCFFVIVFTYSFFSQRSHATGSLVMSSHSPAWVQKDTNRCRRILR